MIVCHECGNPVHHGHYPHCNQAVHVPPWARYEPTAYDRALERYRRADYVNAGAPYWRRHPVVTGIAGLFALSTIIAYWYLAIPLALVAIIVGRWQYKQREYERLTRAADDSMRGLD